MLFYTKGDSWTWNPVFVEYGPDYVERFYKHREPGSGRRYQLDKLTAPGGEAKGNPSYEVMGVTRYWPYSPERMQELIDEGRVVQTKPGAVPRYKRYLDEMPGVPLQDMWVDIGAIGAQAKERIGYPTQKPLALLDRIIRASSNPDDMVLDPFCGCATACVAADRLDRQWVGIDLSPLAADLVDRRMRGEGALLFRCLRRDDVPRRTDQEGVPHYRTQKHTLFGRQEGVCAGCRIMFPFRNMTIDHVVAQARGGTDHLDNLQLLCNACNSMKGTRTQAEFVARLVAEGIREG